MAFIDQRAQAFYLAGRTNKALLFIHGFTASPSEVFPTADLLHKRTGHTVSAPLLPGHGSSPRDLNRTVWLDWFVSVEEEMVNLLTSHEQVFIAGLSAGSLLAIQAALSNPTVVRGVVAINTPIFNYSPLLTISAPVIRYVKPYFPKKSKAKLKELEEQGRFAYEVFPTRAFQSMISLRNQIINDIEKLAVPLLIIQSLHDDSVQPRSAQFLLERATRAKARLVELANSEHIATMGPEKEKIVQEIIRFMS